MPDRHAWFSPSSADRGFKCTPSVRLSEQFPNTTSVYAEEGTKAHSICEMKLKAMLGEQVEIPAALDDEMEECTEAYKDFVEEELNVAKAKTKDAKLFAELEINLDEYIPESFGTSDAVIVSDDTLHVIDFKYGKGVPVDATGNPQLRLYALGAYLAIGKLYDFERIKYTVFQPRIHNIASEDIPVEELLDWAENYVKPRAKLAWEGKGEFVVGDHCRFCKAAATCRARVEDAFKVVDLADTQPATIADDEIPAILDKLDGAEKWIKAIREYAQNKAVYEGVTWPGYKIVEGRSYRKIPNELGALQALEHEGYNTEEVTNVKLKGVTDLEKLLGKPKFAEVLGDFVIKPQGAPTLVKETDKRPEFNPVLDAFKEES